MNDSVQIDDIRVAFIVSHPFQYFFYRDICKHFERRVFVLEKREDTPFEFDAEFLASVDGQIVWIEEENLSQVDGLVDVIFCMTPKHVLHLFKKSRTVALQYSLAKEVYQYGPWRVLADLNLMQGPYSHNLVTGFCNSRAVGNPRYDRLPSPTAPRGESASEKSAPGKKSAKAPIKVLYLPTYGELSSLPVFIEALAEFDESFDVTVKIHHASEFSDIEIVEVLRSLPQITLHTGYHDALDLIVEADVVVSDYSGAIFDAFYADKPLVLIQPEVTQTKIRTEARSLEIARAADMGPVIETAGELVPAIRDALNAPQKWADSRATLRAEVFSEGGNSVAQVVEAVVDLVNGKMVPPLPLESLRTAYFGYIERNRELSATLSATKKSLSAAKKKVATVGAAAKAKAASAPKAD